MKVKRLRDLRGFVGRRYERAKFGSDLRDREVGTDWRGNGIRHPGFQLSPYVIIVI
jgi:hypothetical protein